MDTHRVLVADDNVMNLEVFVSVLQDSNQGYQIYKANGGKEALRLAFEELPDVIILDWMMPDMDGIEVLKKLKLDVSTKDIPVIISTGQMASTEHLRIAFEAGAADFVRKPIERIEFLARVCTAAKFSCSIRKIKDQSSELIRLNKTKDKFLSVISHDLRGPIGNVHSLIGVVIEEIKGKVDEDVIDTVSLLKESIITSYNLLDNLLMWARNNSGRLVFHPEYVDFNTVIEEIIELFSPSAKKKGIELVVDFDDRFEIFADENMVLSMLRNLVSNAIKYTGFGGKVAISAVVESNILTVKVSDTGLGIRKEVQEKIFNPTHFFSTKGTNYEIGSGLGLLICKEFATIHQGSITLESEPGKGSVFSLILPVMPPQSS